jgi:endonuclease III-like uncharacterized protein
MARDVITYSSEIGKINPSTTSVNNTKENNFNSLINIRGIGKETLEDIKRVYTSMELLKLDAISGELPFRNDVGKKLKKYFGGKQ